VDDRAHLGAHAVRVVNAALVHPPLEHIIQFLLEDTGFRAFGESESVECLYKTKAWG
jgi:hypothetical protein